MSRETLDRLSVTQLRERLIEIDPLAPGGMDQIDAILKRLQEVAPISHNTDLVCTYQELVAHFPGGVLPNESKPTTHRHRWKRTALVAATILIAMLVGAVAYAAQRLGLFVSIQEKFTQIQASQGPDALVNT